jgi:hypothetical protein
MEIKEETGMPGTLRTTRYNKFQIIIMIIFLTYPDLATGQGKISFGLHADPVISWFGSDISAIKNEGARSGFKFGLTFNKYFTPNYSFSTGISLVSASGRLISSDTSSLKLDDPSYNTVEVLPGNPVIYKIQYLTLPLGLKMQTNQIGYLSFFSDVGIDPGVITGGHLEIPSKNIKGEKAPEELRLFSLGYHVNAGIEYGLGGNTAFIAGLGFENNFLDVTEDNSGQIKDRISHKMISFRMGIIF